MATTIENAVKGSRKAMTALYKSNKQKVALICSSLLQNEKDISNGVTGVFKGIWKDLPGLNMSSEADFTRFVNKKALNYCKRQITKSDPKALRAPAGKSSAIVSSENSKASAETLDLILNGFHPLYRYIFIANKVAGLSNEDIASLTNTTVSFVQEAKDAELTNINSILDGTGHTLTEAQVKSLLQSRESQMKVPSTADNQAAAEIGTVAAPAEKKAKKRIAIISIIAVICVAIIGTIAGISISNAKKAAAEKEFRDQLAANDYYADITIAGYGTITVSLDSSAAPETVANFVSLAESGFYDGLTFHRIIDGVRMQGGDPAVSGKGVSAQTIVGEFSANGFDNNLSHTRGAISMARADDFNSASSQFFIVHEDSTFLDDLYAAFGYVIDGMDIVDEICTSAEPIDDNGMIAADEQPVITSITIRLGDAAVG